MITRDTIDKIFEATRVEEVISDFVQLKKSGSNLKGLSPFTDEKTPSFMVSPSKQIWKDFSSGKGGNAVTFLMEHEHFTYPEALRYLAKKYGIEVEETRRDDEDLKSHNEMESMYLVSAFARDFFHRYMMEDEMGRAVGLSYFKKRSYREDTIKTFELGYSPDQWDAFTQEALKKGYELKYLEKTGLSIVKGDKKFDRFKGRVIFPIHSMSGRVLGFAGRILSSDKKAAKYLNSPASEIYDKSKILYGIYQAKQSIVKEDNCYLVEGYTDVITLHQTGVLNVVASSGTALTPQQIRLVKRLTSHITVLFDGDDAGIRASMRGIDLLLEQGMDVKVVRFPEGEDPDSYARSMSSENFILFLEENATDFIHFKISLLNEEAQSDPLKKVELAHDIVKSIAVIPDNIKKEVYIKECARLMDISEEVLFGNMAQVLARRDKDDLRNARREREQDGMQVVKKQQNYAEIDQMEKYEREILRLLLVYGNETVQFYDYEIDDGDDDDPDPLIKKKREIVYYENKVADEIIINLQEDEIEFSHPLFQKIYELILRQYEENNNIDLKRLLRSEDQEITETVTSILLNEEKYTLGNWEKKNVHISPLEEKIPKMVKEAIWNIRRILIENLIKQRTHSKKEIHFNQEVMKEIMMYNDLKNKFYQFLHRVL